VSIEKGIYPLLSTEGTITNVVSTNIFPVIAPPGRLDNYITFERVNTEREYSHDGPAGLAKATIAITCWSDTYDGAIDLADIVRKFIDCYTGGIGGYTIQHIEGANESDTGEIDPDTNQIRFGRRLEFAVTFEEAT